MMSAMSGIMSLLVFVQYVFAMVQDYPPMLVLCSPNTKYANFANGVTRHTCAVEKYNTTSL